MPQKSISSVYLFKAIFCSNINSMGCIVWSS